MKLKIAIIGSGTAGAGAALFLHKLGHHITVFERESKPGPVGAGIMLQPTGMKMLSELGLADKALELGCKIHGMYGEDNGQVVVDVLFKNKHKLFGLGIHRGALFSLLHQEVIDQGIDIILDAEISKIRDLKGKKAVIDVHKRSYEGFDIVIVANGSSSSLRKNLGIDQVDQKQPWGALWTKIACDNTRFDGKIQQRYQGSQKLLGLMPIGKYSEDSEEFVNFFWSLKIDQVDIWKKAGIEAFKEEAKALAPKYEDLINQIKSLDDVVVAPYYDVVLQPAYKDKVIFIGDAAHAMSPQLSQGTSFALLDAKILSTYIDRYPGNIQYAFQKYHRRRSRQVYFYQNVSRFITPMFQSDRTSTWTRDFIFNLVKKVVFFRKVMISVALGYRENFFKKLNKKYYKIED